MFRLSQRGSQAKLLTVTIVAVSLLAAVALGSVWATAGVYGLNVLMRHGGTYWIGVSPDSSFLSPSMRLALRTDAVASPGEFSWRVISPGFEVADLPAMVDGRAVDHVFLARVDPSRFRFAVRNAPAGDKTLDAWMRELKPALVVNGSYFARDGKPDTPFVSDGVPLGPADYDAKSGAFVASPAFTGIRDLSHIDWKTVFQGADNAMVSYPLLVASGSPAVATASRWLANRSFVGQDKGGLIIVGATTDAFFSLYRLAQFLASAPLGLALALNLDGGPVASQAISLSGFERKTYGRWEAQVQADKVELLAWPYGSVSMPVVLAVFPK